MARSYAINLPYTTTAKDGLAIMAGLEMPEVQAALSRINPALVAKLKRVGVWHHETFTRAELDSVPQDLWVKLEPHLG